MKPLSGPFKPGLLQVRGQYISKREMGVASDGRPQGPTPRILSPLAPTIRRIGPPRLCMVGDGALVTACPCPPSPLFSLFERYWGQGRAAIKAPTPHPLLSRPYAKGDRFRWGDGCWVTAGAGGHKGPHSATLPLPPLREGRAVSLE